MHGFRQRVLVVLATAGIAVTLHSVQTSAWQAPRAAGSVAAPAPQEVFGRYCVACHNQTVHTAGLALDSLDLTNPAPNAEVWEQVIARLHAGSMPPPGNPRPDAATYRAVANSLEREIDRAWEASP